MKKLYGLQAFLGFLLYLLGFNLQKEQERLIIIFYEEGYEAGPYGNPSMYFAMIAGIYCVYCFFVAARTSQRLRLAGTLWGLTTFGFGVFAIIMHSSPRGISLAESLWSWFFYIVIAWIWSFWAYQKIDKVALSTIYEDEILDDL